VHGPEVVISAPGVGLATTAVPSFAESGYANTGKTSGTTAIVAGVVALIRSRFPQMDAKNVVNRLIATAKDRACPAGTRTSATAPCGPATRSRRTCRRRTSGAAVHPERVGRRVV
jgi:subtilisin family serine protease